MKLRVGKLSFVAPTAYPLTSENIVISVNISHYTLESDRSLCQPITKTSRAKDMSF